MSALALPAKRQGHFTTRTFRLIGQAQLDQLLSALRSIPLDPFRPLEAVLREPQKQRSPDANARMWAGPLKDIERQAWVDDGSGKKRRYRDVVWHDYFKRAYLPEEHEDGITKEGYAKWSTAPDGERVLVGSTTQLTPRGFSQYLAAIEAYAVSELGVKFSVSPNEIILIP